MEKRIQIVNKEGKRIDGKASTKEINKKLKEEDPIIRNAEKGTDEEYSPMDPPEAYDETKSIGLEYDQLHSNLKELCDEHKGAVEKCDAFEKALQNFKEGDFFITKEINDAFNSFFVHFDEHILPHNKKEERGLFPILRKRMLETGEHSKGENPHTPVDLMEDDHVKLLQLTTLSFNFLNLAFRIKDNEARFQIFDVFFHNAKELIELLKLHIYREDNTIFPMAQKLLTEEEMNTFYN